MKNIEKFEAKLNSLLDWNRRQSISFDCKNPDLKLFKKQKDFIDSLKKELLNMYKND